LLVVFSGDGVPTEPANTPGTEGAGKSEKGNSSEKALTEGKAMTRVRLPVVAGWSSLVARQAHNLKVAGSNPAPAPNLDSPPTAREGFLLSDLRDFRKNDHPRATTGNTRQRLDTSTKHCAKHFRTKITAGCLKTLCEDPSDTLRNQG
jgi:hypothetical protein